MKIILTGVSGVGKTTIGRLLAKKLNYEFLDADDFHPAKNIEKMHQGIPLHDEDRMPWLERLHGALESRPRVVLACSALKRSYRDILATGISVSFVNLVGDFELIKSRLQSRNDHFMNLSLLKSQFETFEMEKDDFSVDVSKSPKEIVGIILRGLDLSEKS
jgi:carbohydrate kinase (thermoresistant glucokinase family)